MGITAIVSSIVIVATLVWSFYSFALIQFGVVRPYPAHFDYDTIPYWPYTNNFTGGRTNWFDNMNYTNLEINQTFPDDLLDYLNEVVFVVIPKDPGQLWRQEAYNAYDGARWTKTIPDSIRPLSSEELIQPENVTNPIYTIVLNANAGAGVGTFELPSLFPALRVIEGSFKTYSIIDGTPVEDSPSRLLYYSLETDDYGTLLFSPLIQGTTGEQVPISFDITYINQDLQNVALNALPGSAAPLWTHDYLPLPALTQRVLDNISQFESVGTNAFEKAIAVQTYFQNTFELNITPEILTDRPTSEVTDWFLARGNGLPLHFATAYAVFMRHLGIPARLVSGYALGEPDPVEDFRTVMNRHMVFWVEVFIPLPASTTGGEWIQVVPIPLPPEYGGGEDPENAPVPNIQMYVWPSNGLPYAEIGTPFNLSAAITIDGFPLTTPDSVIFFDETDSRYIGTGTIGQFPDLPFANVTYTFPIGSTVSYHTISATWVSSFFSVQNTTQVFAVGTPTPFLENSQVLPDFIPSETQELNVSQGLDSYQTTWMDTVHVYGTMKVDGVPVNSSLYDNKYIQIMWDNTIVGDAFINENGYYEYDIFVDPMNHALMSVGQHEVWSWYAGDWDGPIPRLLEARSLDNSTITVWGTVGFTLSVTPGTTYPGGTLQYDGSIAFLNGTLLPSGQSVSVFFGSQANASRPVNVTGGFDWSYVIPLAQSDGTYFARANWTNSLGWPYIVGNWSLAIPIDVGAGGTNLWMNPLPNPVFIKQNVSLWGYLTHVANGTGISGRWVDVWWSNGTPINLGPVLTASDGSFNISYIVPTGYEGTVEYWVSFTSVEPLLASSELTPHLFTTAKRYDVEISILVNPDPAHLLQTVTIQGAITLPENTSSPLAFVELEIWWGNSTAEFLLGTTLTNSTGGYVFYYQVPIGHSIEIVDVWANYTSLFTNIADGESLRELLSIETTDTIITVNEDFTYYYLNETVLLYGHLQFANGTPLSFEKVYIHWVNSSGTWVFEKYTDINGDYQFLYNLSASMDTGLIDVHVNWTSYTPIYPDAFDTLVPSIQLQKYEVEFSLIYPSQIYVDEDLVVQGNLTYLGGSPPLIGATVYIAYWNGTHYVAVANPMTNSTGGFLTLPISFAGNEEYTYSFAAVYLSSDPVVNTKWEYFDVTRIKYAVNLELSYLPGTSVYQNDTLTVQAYLYYQHNGTPISGADLGIWWNNGTLYFLGNITTDGTGHGTLIYSDMDYDTIRTNIGVYANYAGTILLASNVTSSTIVTLLQWQTELIGITPDAVIYRLTETVIVTGNLRFIVSGSPYAGVTVELLLSSIPLNSTLTGADGSFVLYWIIPQNTPTGFYDLTVRFQSSYPWIADAQASVPQFEVVAPGYLWPSFIVAPESPTQVFILDILQIDGVVSWDNGSAYQFSTVSLFWGDPLGTWYFMKNVTTDIVGAFSTNFQVPSGTTVGTRHVWAYIAPSGYATFGISPSRTIDVATYTVILTASLNTTVVHLGEFVEFSGTATFENSTPLVGYEIEIWWDGQLLNTATVTALGTFSYIHEILYSEPLGVKSGYALFYAPSGAFVNTTEYFVDITVREFINLFMDAQPAITIFSRGDIFTVTGNVTNDIDLPVVGAVVRVLANGTPLLLSDTTGADGTFSIDIAIPTNQPPGLYIITIESIGLYHDALSAPSSWEISVYMNSVVDIVVTNSESLMPGESFSVTLQLLDDARIPINGATIHVLINSLEVASRTLVDGNGGTFSITIPLSWSSGNGVFTVSAEYDGGPYINGHTSSADISIHIFTNVVFSNLSPSIVPPGQSFFIDIELHDSDGNPIRNRPVLLSIVGETSTSQNTGAEGGVTYSLTAQEAGTQVLFTITLISSAGNIDSNQYTILIQTQGGNILQGTDLIIAGILLVGAVIAVLAYLYIVKGMFRSPVISRGVDIPTKLRNIKKLADAGKYGASITLAYRTFEQMCGTKMGSERMPSETARDYLDRVLQAIPLDSGTVMQFEEIYEEARFSHHEMTRERYEAALRVFTDLYPRIDTAAPME